YCDVDLLAFHHCHEKYAADASLVLARVPDTTRFGRISLGDDGRVLSFAEKAGASSGWINAGIYLLERSRIEEMPPGRPSSLERDLFPVWLGRKRVYGFPCAGRFLDIGTPESYAEAELLTPCSTTLIC